MTVEKRTAVPEHRSKPRKHIAQEFVLTHPAIGVQNLWTRDLSLDSAFVEGDLTALEPGTLVEMEFTLLQQGKSASYRFSATVTRVTDEGVGLKFHSLDMETYAALLDVMHAA